MSNDSSINESFWLDIVPVTSNYPLKVYSS
jgi:hypothetical protein